MTRLQPLSLVRVTHGLRPDIRGIAAVEFALLAPILVLLVIGAADISMALFEQMVVTNAAASGAAYASQKGYNSSGIVSAVTSATSLSLVQATPAPSEYCGCPNVSSGVVNASCGSTCPSGAKTGTYGSISARATYSLMFNIPGFPTSTVLSSTVVVRLQ